MIPQAEIRRRARSLGIQEAHILRDYVLNHVLVGVSQEFPELVFRGGTALARVYWPDYRLSEDLDFIAEGRVLDLEDRLESAVAKSSDRLERSLNLKFGPSKKGWSRSTIESEFGEMLLDLNLEERTYLPVEEEALNLPYSDLDESVTIRAVSIPEILGNKWFMLKDRGEPRDLYDLWAGFTKFDVSFEAVERGHRAKYGFPPLLEGLKAARGFEEKWETRLRHQLSNLPSLDEVVSNMQAIFDSWASSSRENSQRHRRSPGDAL